MSGDHFFPVQRITVEFLRGSVLILDLQLDLCPGRNRVFGGLEAVIIDHQLIVGIGISRARISRKQQGKKQQANCKCGKREQQGKKQQTFQSDLLDDLYE